MITKTANSIFHPIGGTKILAHAALKGAKKLLGLSKYIAASGRATTSLGKKIVTLPDYVARKIVNNPYKTMPYVLGIGAFAGSLPRAVDAHTSHVSGYELTRAQPITGRIKFISPQHREFYERFD